jgi:hypothetical protein
LTETWLSPDISNSELGFNGLDRNTNTSLCSRGGGVLIAVKSNYYSSLIATNNNTVEQLFVLLTISSINFIIGAVYLPPNCPLQLYESHANTVEDIVSKYTPIPFVLCGDFNIPGVDWSCDNLGLIASGTLSPSATIISDSLSLLNFFQCNNVQNHLGGLLDLIFSCKNDVSVEKAPSSLVGIDLYHPPLAVTYPLPNQHKDEVNFTYRDFKAANYTSITEFFNSYNWLATFSTHNANDAAAVFNDALLYCINRFVPLKVCKNPKFPQWVSNDLKNLIVNKKKAHITFKKSSLAIDYNIFSELRAKCKRLSKLDYSAYIRRTERSLSISPRNFWKYVRDLKETTPIPISVQYLDSLSNNPLESATLFSNYFGSVFQSPISLLSPDSCKLSYNLPSNCYFTPDDVLEALTALQSITSSGPDGISARLLYNCRNSLFFPIFLLFRLSMDEGIFPSLWKISSITPILKSGDPSQVVNYRPISILPHIAKIFESIVYNCIKRSVNHILIPQQHGFRPGKSTITSGVYFT